MTMKMITVCTEKNDHFSGIILVSCTVYCSLCEIISITWDETKINLPWLSDIMPGAYEKWNSTYIQ